MVKAVRCRQINFSALFSMQKVNIWGGWERELIRKEKLTKKRDMLKQITNPKLYYIIYYYRYKQTKIILRLENYCNLKNEPLKNVSECQSLYKSEKAQESLNWS